VLLVLRLVRGALLLRCDLFPVENRLFQERCLGRNEVGALQLQRQESVKVSPGKTSSEKIDITTKANKVHREDKQLTIFSIPALGSIGSSRDGCHE
jgi:hypothetical protein